MVNRKNEDLTFADVNMSSINYFFDDGRLSSVTAMFHSESNFQKLKEFSFRTYGEQSMSSHDKQWKRRFNYPKYEKYRWEGVTTIVELMYAPDFQSSYYGQLAYSSAKRRLEEPSEHGS